MYTKEILVSIGLFAFIGCSQPTASNKDAKMDNNAISTNTTNAVRKDSTIAPLGITKVVFKSYGGMMGYSDSVLITKDSAIRVTIIGTQNKYSKKAVAMVDTVWSGLTNSIAWDKFVALKSGESAVPMDGIDDEIIVFNNNASHTVINANKKDANYKTLEKVMRYITKFRNDVK